MVIHMMMNLGMISLIIFSFNFKVGPYSIYGSFVHLWTNAEL